MEKALFNQVGEVKGKVIESEDSFSFQFTPQNENLKRTRGALFTLVTVHGEAEDKIEKAKAYYHSFQSSYYAKATGSIINGLSETLDHVEKEFSKMEAEDGVTFSLVAAVFWGAVLYLAKSGTNCVFVSRSGKLKKLDFAKVASGVLEDQDTVCLATEKFSTEVSNEDLADLLGNEKFEDVLEKIDKRIAEVPAAVCDVIRLSVNRPSEEPQPTSIGEVDSDGKIDLGDETGKEQKADDGTGGDEQSEQVAKVNDAVSISTAKKHQFSDILTKAQDSWLPALFEKLKPLTNFLAKPWRKAVPGEHVDHVAVRRQRLMQIVAAIILILIVSITFSWVTGTNSKNKEKLDSLISSATQSLNEAKSIKSVDPGRANSLVNDAKKSTAAAKILSPKDNRIAHLESQEAELIAEINRSYNLNNLTTVADFTKLVKNASISRLTINGTTLLATDQNNNNIYSFDLSSKNLSQIDGSFTKPDNLAAYSSGYYVQTADGISKIDQTGKASSIGTNASWGEIVGAATYQNNLYLLDKGNQEIWKYIATSNGLSSARAYLQGNKPTLSDASGIAIDSFVWVVTKSGNVYKIAVGKKQDFSITNMQEALSNVVDIYTDSNAKNLYLLDQGKARIVVIGKDGVYQAQYSNDQLHQATSLVVLEDQKTAYVSVNGKILSVNLK